MKHKLLSAFFAMSTLSAFTQKNYWHPISQSSALRMNNDKSLFTNAFQPAAYQLFTLDENAFIPVLQHATSEKNVSAGIVISVPLASGKIEKFRIIGYSVMEAGLQAKYQNIRSYVGQGIDNASRTIACSFTSLGFHASIRSVDEKTMYINPVNKKANLYSVFARNDNDRSENKLLCELSGDIQTEKVTLNRTAPKGNADNSELLYFSTCKRNRDNNACGNIFFLKLHAEVQG